MSSIRHRPLLRFEAHEKAKVVSTHSSPLTATSTEETTKTSMKRKGAYKKRRVGRGRKGSSRKKTGRVGKRPRVVKGRVQLKISGYSGVQRLPPSSLIPFLPIARIKAAAKRALLASGKKRTTRKKRRTGSKRRRS